MRKIRFYQQDGRIHDEQELTHDSLYGAMGMMARCYLRDDSIHDGFVCFQTDIGNDPESGIQTASETGSQDITQTDAENSTQTIFETTSEITVSGSEETENN